METSKNLYGFVEFDNIEKSNLELPSWFNKKNVLFAYYGKIDMSVIRISINQINDLIKENPVFRKRFIKIFIEMTQNVLCHSEKDYKNLEKVHIFIHSNESKYYISTVNTVKNIAIKKLADHLGKIIAMNKEELIRYKFDTLKNRDRNTKGGRIGFAQISILSSEPVVIRHYPFNSDFSELFISSTIINNS